MTPAAVIRKFLIMCSGANLEILSRPECVTEIPKFIGIGAAIFFTAILSFLSGSYALYLAFPSSLTLSLLLGLLWSLIVFNLDRFLIVRIKKTRTAADPSFGDRIKQKFRELLVAMPRVLFGIFVSLVVATPLELKLFEKDLNAEIARQQMIRRTGVEKMVLSEFPFERLSAENLRLQQEIDIKEKETSNLRQLILDRKSQSLTERLYKDRKHAFEESEQELHKLKETNQQRIAANNQTLEQLQAQANERTRQYHLSIGGNGLLARLEALNTLKVQSSAIELAALFITILFILLLTSPVLVRLLSEAGPYERFLMAIEAMANEETNLSKGRKATADRTDNKQKTTAKKGITQNSTPLLLRHLNVFLSHSSADKPAIRDLYRRLKADGVEPWLDEEKILAGQEWSHEIIEAVRSTDVVIVCLSRGAITRVGFLQKEIRFALEVAAEQPEGTIFLIPAKLEECEVPHALRQLQWVNLFEEGGYQKLMLSLSARALVLGVAVDSQAERT